MSTRKITELTNVTSIQDDDLLIVETSEGTRSIKKCDIDPLKVRIYENFAATGLSTASCTTADLLNYLPENITFQIMCNNDTIKITDLPFQYGILTVSKTERSDVGYVLTGFFKCSDPTNTGELWVIDTVYDDNNNLVCYWESVNPAMKSGVEYRTIERYDDKVVYAKLENGYIKKYLSDGTDITSAYRGFTVASTETTPTANNTINWVYE